MSAAREMADFRGEDFVSTMVTVLSGGAAADAAPWPTPGTGVWILPPDATRLATHVGAHPADCVVALARPQDARAARLAMTVAAGAHPQTRFALRTAPASVLALAAVGRQAVDNTQTGSDVVRFVDAQLADTMSGAWLRRVDKLHKPSAGLWQHLRSILPGSPGFVVRLGAEPSVISGPCDVPGETTLLVGADDAATTGRSVRGSRPVAVPAAVDTAAAYGSAGAEFVALPPARALPAASATCAVCREPSDASVCPFCHVVLTQEFAA